MSEVGHNDIRLSALLYCSCNTLCLIFRVQKIHDDFCLSEFAQASVKCGADW